MPMLFLNIIVACLHVLFGGRGSGPPRTVLTRIALTRAEARSIALLASVSSVTAQCGSRSLKGELVPDTVVHELHVLKLPANRIDS